MSFNSSRPALVLTRRNGSQSSVGPAAESDEPIRGRRSCWGHTPTQTSLWGLNLFRVEVTQQVQNTTLTWSSQVSSWCHCVLTECGLSDDVSLMTFNQLLPLNGVVSQAIHSDRQHQSGLTEPCSGSEAETERLVRSSTSAVSPPNRRAERESRMKCNSWAIKKHKRLVVVWTLCVFCVCEINESCYQLLASGSAVFSWSMDSFKVTSDARKYFSTLNGSFQSHFLTIWNRKCPLSLICSGLFWPLAPGSVLFTNSRWMELQLSVTSGRKRPLCWMDGAILLSIRKQADYCMKLTPRPRWFEGQDFDHLHITHTATML